MLGGVAFFSPAVLLPLIVWGGFVGRGLSPYLGGWQWQSASYALWEQTACVALCAGLLVFYRERINNGSLIWKILAADSFGIYLLHPPVVVAVSQGFGWLRLPPLLKAAVMAPIACLCVWVFVHFVARRVPLLRRII
jgi:peptidoglycan/LPS O-acetylase OafA/YrhL